MELKFPFYSCHKNELPYVTAEIAEREKFKYLKNNPDMFRGFESSNNFQHPAQIHIHMARAPRLNSEPSISISRPIYERRQFVQEKKTALKAAAKPNLISNPFLDHFEEFSRVTVHFFQNGKHWLKPQGVVLRADEIFQIRTHDEWLDWILAVKARDGKDFNWFHPDWANSLLRNQYALLTEAEQARIRSFMNSFLDYTRCQKHRHKVRIINTESHTNYRIYNFPL